MDPLEWEGAVSMIVWTADKNITIIQVIQTIIDIRLIFSQKHRFEVENTAFHFTKLKLMDWSHVDYTLKKNGSKQYQKRVIRFVTIAEPFL